MDKYNVELNHLTETERDAIMAVLKRDEDLRSKEQDRVREMKTELKNVRLKGVIKEGTEPDKTCARCLAPLGWLINRGALCPQCHAKVCHDCQHFSDDQSTWMCVLCFKQMEVTSKSGDWFYSRFRKSKRHKKTNKPVLGSELVRASIHVKVDDGVAGRTVTNEIKRVISNNNASPKSQHSGSTSFDGESSDTLSMETSTPVKHKGDIRHMAFPKESDTRRLMDLVKPRHKEQNGHAHVQVRRVHSKRYDSESSSSDSEPNSPHLSARTGSQVSDSVRSSIRSSSAISSDGRKSDNASDYETHSGQGSPRTIPSKGLSLDEVRTKRKSSDSPLDNLPHSSQTGDPALNKGGSRVGAPGEVCPLTLPTKESSSSSSEEEEEEYTVELVSQVKFRRCSMKKKSPQNSPRSRSPSPSPRHSPQPDWQRQLSGHLSDAPNSEKLRSDSLDLEVSGELGGAMCSGREGQTGGDVNAIAIANQHVDTLPPSPLVPPAQVDSKTRTVQSNHSKHELLHEPISMSDGLANISNLQNLTSVSMERKVVGVTTRTPPPARSDRYSLGAMEAVNAEDLPTISQPHLSSPRDGHAMLVDSKAPQGHTEESGSSPDASGNSSDEDLEWDDGLHVHVKHQEVDNDSIALLDELRAAVAANMAAAEIDVEDGDSRRSPVLADYSNDYRIADLHERGDFLDDEPLEYTQFSHGISEASTILRINRVPPVPDETCSDTLSVITEETEPGDTVSGSESWAKSSETEADSSEEEFESATVKTMSDNDLDNMDDSVLADDMLTRHTASEVGMNQKKEKVYSTPVEPELSGTESTLNTSFEETSSQNQFQTPPQKRAPLQRLDTIDRMAIAADASLDTDDGLDLSTEYKRNVMAAVTPSPVSKTRASSDPPYKPAVKAAKEEDVQTPQKSDFVTPSKSAPLRVTVDRKPIQTKVLPVEPNRKPSPLEHTEGLRRKSSSPETVDGKPVWAEREKVLKKHVEIDFNETKKPEKKSETFIEKPLLSPVSLDKQKKKDKRRNSDGKVIDEKQIASVSELQKLFDKPKSQRKRMDSNNKREDSEAAKRDSFCQKDIEDNSSDSSFSSTNVEMKEKQNYSPRFSPVTDSQKYSSDSIQQDLLKERFSFQEKGASAIQEPHQEKIPDKGQQRDTIWVMAEHADELLKGQIREELRKSQSTDKKRSLLEKRDTICVMAEAADEMLGDDANLDLSAQVAAYEPTETVKMMEEPSVSAHLSTNKQREKVESKNQAPMSVQMKVVGVDENVSEKELPFNTHLTIVAQTERVRTGTDPPLFQKQDIGNETKTAFKLPEDKIDRDVKKSHTASQKRSLLEKRDTICVMAEAADEMLGDDVDLDLSAQVAAYEQTETVMAEKEPSLSVHVTTHKKTEEVRTEKEPALSAQLIAYDRTENVKAEQKAAQVGNRDTIWVLAEKAEDVLKSEGNKDVKIGHATGQKHPLLEKRDTIMVMAEEADEMLGKDKDLDLSAQVAAYEKIQTSKTEKGPQWSSHVTHYEQTKKVSTEKKLSLSAQMTGHDKTEQKGQQSKSRDTICIMAENAEDIIKKETKTDAQKGQITGQKHPLLEKRDTICVMAEAADEILGEDADLDLSTQIAAYEQSGSILSHDRKKTERTKRKLVRNKTPVDTEPIPEESRLSIKESLTTVDLEETEAKIMTSDACQGDSVPSSTVSLQATKEDLESKIVPISSTVVHGAVVRKTDTKRANREHFVMSAMDDETEVSEDNSGNSPTEMEGLARLKMQLSTVLKQLDEDSSTDDWVPNLPEKTPPSAVHREAFVYDDDLILQSLGNVDTRDPGVLTEKSDKFESSPKSEETQRTYRVVRASSRHKSSSSSEEDFDPTSSMQESTPFGSSSEDHGSESRSEASPAIQRHSRDRPTIERYSRDRPAIERYSQDRPVSSTSEDSEPADVSMTSIGESASFDELSSADNLDASSYGGLSGDDTTSVERCHSVDTLGATSTEGGLSTTSSEKENGSSPEVTRRHQTKTNNVQRNSFASLDVLLDDASDTAEERAHPEMLDDGLKDDVMEEYFGSGQSVPEQGNNETNIASEYSGKPCTDSANTLSDPTTLRSPFVQSTPQTSPYQDGAQTHGHLALPSPILDTKAEASSSHTDEEDGRRSPADGRRSPVDGRRSPVDGRRSPIDGRRSPIDGRRSPIDGRWSPRHHRSASPRSVTPEPPCGSDVQIREHKDGSTKSRSSASSVPSISVTQHEASELQSDASELGSLYEENIDDVFASHGSSTLSRASENTSTRSTNLLTPFSESRESIVSYYSDAGGGNFGNITVTGEILFGIDYNYKTGMLEVRVKQCKDLAVADTKKKRSDPYVKTYLLPDKTKGGKRKTKVKKHTLNPTFDEVLKYQLTKSELETRTLWVTVWHNDTFGRNDFLGEVTIPLDYYTFDDPAPKWYPLQSRSPSPMSMLTYKGDLIVALRYVTSDNVTTRSKRGKKGNTGELQVLIKEARNLTAVRANGFSDPFCKGYLLPEKSRSVKQKTSVIKKDCNPQWNHTFVFEEMLLEELRERSLELSIWDHDRFTSNDFLGGVRLNLGTGKCHGKDVDWMDAKGEEMSTWQSMLDRPNCWIDASLMLRPNMDKRK